MKSKCLLFIVFLYTGHAGGQKLTWDQIDRSLAEEGKIILADTNAANRQAAVDRVMSLFTTELQDAATFRNKFTQASFFSVLYPADSSFRILTGQHFVNDNEYRYYGGIQRSSGGFIPFTDRSYENDEEGIAYEELHADEWQGALYYRLFDCKLKGEPYYLLLGYNSYKFFQRRKIMDVLSFDENNQPVFGKDVFLPDSTDRGETQLRYIYTHSADVSMKLNYDKNEGIIVLDHLMPVKEIFKGQGETAVPDGSYEGYKYKKGKWQHISVLSQKSLDNIEVRPVLKDQKGTNIFGRSRSE